MNVRKPAAWWAAQYDNRARVADSAGHLARWAMASAFVRERAACRLGLRYGEDEAQTLDLVLPDRMLAATAAPVLVVLPGGDWRAGSQADLTFLAASFADEGALVVLPRHGGCPDVHLERLATQLTEALAWVWRHAAEHGGDPSRVVLLGHGAGGHLAAMLACCDWKRVGRDLPRRLLSGVVSISGVHDLAPLQHLPRWRAELQLDAATVRRLSPVHFPAPAAPLVVHVLVGALESQEHLRQAQALRDAWGPRAVPVCETLPGRDHYTVMLDLADPEGQSHQRLRRLLGLRWYSGLC